MKVFLCIATFLVVTVLFLSSCKSSKKTLVPTVQEAVKPLTQTDIQALPKVLEFSKSACRGTCPYFNLTVYQDGHLVFEGKRHTLQEGIATDKLTKEEFAQLQMHCEAADLWNRQPAYGMNVMDIPTTTVHFYEGGKDKEVKWRLRAPEQLPTLSNQIMELIYARNWVERNDRNKEKGIKLPAQAIENEVIIQFKEKIDAEAWCKQYERYGLLSKKALSTTTPIYLMSFDTGKMAPDKMLEIINNDEKVATAEFNKRMGTRGRN